MRTHDKDGVTINLRHLKKDGRLQKSGDDIGYNAEGKRIRGGLENKSWIV